MARCSRSWVKICLLTRLSAARTNSTGRMPEPRIRSEEHTSELQSLRHLVCCLLLEKNICRRFSHNLRSSRRTGVGGHRSTDQPYSIQKPQCRNTRGHVGATYL